MGWRVGMCTTCAVCTCFVCGSVVVYEGVGGGSVKGGKKPSWGPCRVRERVSWGLEGTGLGLNRTGVELA